MLMGRREACWRISVVAVAILGSGPVFGSTVYWDGGTNFQWTTAANWSSAPNLPGSSDDAILNESPYGSPYTVTLASGSESINSLITDSTSDLKINSGSLTLANASTIASTLTLSGNLTSNANIAIAGGTLAGGEVQGAGSMTLTSSFTWSYGTIGINTATVSKNATLNITTTFENLHQLYNTLQNNGTIICAGGIFTENTTTLNNAGTFDANTGNYYSVSYNTTSNFNNGGSFISNGTVAFAGNADYPFIFNNTGNVDVQTGSLQLGYGNTGSSYTGGINSGTIMVESGATLILGGNYSYAAHSSITGPGNVTVNYGTHSFPAGSFTPTGTVNFTGSDVTINNTFYPTTLAPFNYGSANFNASETFPAMTLGGATVSGSGNILITGALTWTGGTMNGSGTMHISSGTTPDTSTLNLNTGPLVLGRTLQVDGSTSWTSGQISFTAANFINNGTFTVNTNATGSGLAINSNSTLASAFNNAGTLIKQGSGFAQINGGGSYPMTFNNTGTVDVQSGTLALGAAISQITGTTLTGGSWIIENGATLFLPSSGNFTTLAPGASVTLEGAKSTLTNMNALINNQGAFTIEGGRNFTPTAAFANSGTLVIGSMSTFEATAALSNTGIIDVAGGTLKLDQGLAFNSIRAELSSGSNSGAWNGTGIISSLAAMDPTHATGVGYTVNGSAYVLMDTWYGDTDLSGTVTYSDLQAMVPGATNATWQQGDFNYDGVVNADDFSLFMLGDANQTGTFPTVPEPGISALIAAGLATQTQRKRKAHG